MAVIKCKMCGGDLEVIPGLTVAECEYCGSMQTLPTAKDENLQNIYNRANTLRIKSEFDKAEKLYEKIIQTDGTQSEAYWGLILCKYGIEYVDDPATFKKIPTCHRASYDSIIADEDYKLALEYADSSQRAIYEEQAQEIDRIQRDILALAQREETYDVFICYKETDADGRRTQDSVIANDIYYQLTNEGFKVFYAAITLEGKLGSAYEPIIFAALNSAKVMLSIGTKPEYFNAVWVKNEWSRFLKIIKKDRSKLLIPCYRDMDAYELPEEFAHLQAQDMSKIGFINDIVRGIKKVIATDEPKSQTKVKAASTVDNAAVTPLLKRIFMFLEDGDWSSANEYCEKVLDIDPENAYAYAGKLMVDLRVKKQEDLQKCNEPFGNNLNYQKALRFADDDLKNALTSYVEYITIRNERTRLEGIYQNAKNAASAAITAKNYIDAAMRFESISDYEDSAARARECRERAEDARKDEILTACKKEMGYTSASIELSIELYEGIITRLETIADWKDAAEQIENCKKKIEEIRDREEILRKEAERKAKVIKITILSSIAAILAAAGIIALYFTVIKPANQYKEAMALKEAGEYRQSIMLFSQLGDYKDARDQTIELLKYYVAENNNGVLDASYSHTVRLHKDGTVSATDDANNFYQGWCDVDGWTDIVAISASDSHTVGLKSDGSVVAVGSNTNGKCAVKNWENIVAVGAGRNYTMGLTGYGTVCLTGGIGDGTSTVSAWENIVAISAGPSVCAGLKDDGTVVTYGMTTYAEKDIAKWTDIVAISVGDAGVVGIKQDGTIMALVWGSSSLSDIGDWTDIKMVSVGADHIVGLKNDGTVVAVGDNAVGQLNVSGWSDVVEISAGDKYTVALKSDGTVVAVGYNGFGQCNVDCLSDASAETP